ncbi:hypothetical protein IMY05_C2141000500 [Salix suchowensis]|nr:hypothetical protein IMY05_C2141000500 [Salix suchowensis]
MKTELDAHDLPVASTGWVGVRDRKTNKSRHSAQELVDAEDFKLVEWDGRAGAVAAVLLGQARGLQWGEAVEDATTAIKNAAAQPCVSELAGEHRRGPFPAAAIGISYGGGQKKPGNLRLGGPEIQNVLEDLIKNKGIQRLAGFAASTITMTDKPAYSPRSQNEIVSQDLGTTQPTTATAPPSTIPEPRERPEAIPQSNFCATPQRKRRRL